RTKAEVVSNQYPAGRKTLVQNADNKILRADSREIEIETAYPNPLHASCCQQLQLLTQAGEPGRRLVGGKKLARVRLENHDARSQAKTIPGFFQPGKHGLVAKMHTIEIAYGKGN